jgi:hypothetical protein
MKTKLITVVLVMLALYAAGSFAAAITYDQDFYNKNKRFAFSANSNDPLYMFIGEQEGIIEGSGLTATGVALNDAASISYGTGLDFVVNSDTANTLDYTTAVTDGTGIINFGNDANGIDVKFFGETAGDSLLFDASGNELISEDIKINIMDDTVLAFGDAEDVTMQYDEDGNDDLQIVGAVGFDGTVGFAAAVTCGTSLTVDGVSTLTGAATATAGIQSAAVSATATTDGLTTGLIPSGTAFVTVTTDDVNKVVVLPAAVIGNVIRIVVPATGGELQTLASSNATINGVDCDGANEMAMTAASVYVLTCTAADTWIAYGWGSDGAAQATIVPDVDS